MRLSVPSWQVGLADCCGNENIRSFSVVTNDLMTVCPRAAPGPGCHNISLELPDPNGQKDTCNTLYKMKTKSGK